MKLNASTGSLIWNYTFVGKEEVVSSPTVVNGVVYFGYYDHNVYALNATTGAKIWNYTTGFSVESSPAISNNVVYICSEDGNLYALNAITGEKKWSYEVSNLLQRGWGFRLQLLMAGFM